MELTMLTLVTSFYNEEDGVSSYFTILNQITEFFPQISIVLVNNASTDQTLRLLNKYSLSDSRIIVVDNPTGLGYADGILVGIRNSQSNHVLIFPGDLQFNIDAVKKILNYYLMSINVVHEHINILSFRKNRFDGRKNEFRGTIWKKIIQLLLNMGSNIDAASQLRVLCKCCIANFETNDFFWDIEVANDLFKKSKISGIVEVDFHARMHGESSIKNRFFKIELFAFKRLLKVRLKSNKTKN